MSKKKQGSLAAQSALAVREPQTSWISSVNTMLDTFRLVPGFEWPAEYERPSRKAYVDVIDSGIEAALKAH